MDSTPKDFFQGEPVIQRYFVGTSRSRTGRGPDQAALYMDNDISSSNEGLKKTIEKHGFDATKWNAQTYAYLEKTVREIYELAGKSDEFKGMSPLTYAELPPEERGNLLPIESAVKMAVPYANYKPFTTERELQVYDCKSLVENSREIITPDSHLYESGCLFESIPVSKRPNKQVKDGFVFSEDKLMANVRVGTGLQGNVDIAGSHGAETTIFETIKQHGFDATKWHVQTFKNLEYVVGQIYAAVGKANAFKGVSPHVFAEMPSGEQKISIENATLMALSYLREKRKRGVSDYPIDKQERRALANEIIPMSKEIIGLECFQSGGVFEGAMPPIAKPKGLDYKKLEKGLAVGIDTDREMMSKISRLRSSMLEVYSGDANLGTINELAVYLRAIDEGRPSGLADLTANAALNDVRSFLSLNRDIIAAKYPKEMLKPKQGEKAGKPNPTGHKRQQQTPKPT